MNFELTIKGDSFEEIASIFSRNTTVPRDKAFVARSEPDVQTHDAPRDSVKEVEPEAEAEVEAPKPGRTRKPKAEKPADDEKANDAPPSEEKVTFEDIRALASSLMDSGKVEAKAIQEMLVAKFDARAFGALKEEQYADCLAELQNLG